MQHLTVWDGFNFGVGLMLVLICAKLANAIFMGIVMKRHMARVLKDIESRQRRQSDRPSPEAVQEAMKEMERAGLVVEEGGKWRIKSKEG